MKIKGRISPVKSQIPSNQSCNQWVPCAFGSFQRPCRAPAGSFLPADPITLLNKCTVRSPIKGGISSEPQASLEDWSNLKAAGIIYPRQACCFCEIKYRPFKGPNPVRNNSEVMQTALRCSLPVWITCGNTSLPKSASLSSALPNQHFVNYSNHLTSHCCSHVPAYIKPYVNDGTFSFCKLQCFSHHGFIEIMWLAVFIYTIE